MTWEECARLNMSNNEAAAAMGLSPGRASIWARKLGLKFRDARRDPEQAALMSARSKAAWKDPATRQRMLAPLLKRNTENHPCWPVGLTESELTDYRFLRRWHYSRDEALRAVNRADLVADDEAAA